MKQIYVEKLVTFTYCDGRFDVALFSGEFLPDVKWYWQKIPVPADLMAGELQAELMT